MNNRLRQLQAKDFVEVLMMFKLSFIIIVSIICNNKKLILINFEKTNNQIKNKMYIELIKKMSQGEAQEDHMQPQRTRTGAPALQASLTHRQHQPHFQPIGNQPG